MNGMCNISLSQHEVQEPYMQQSPCKHVLKIKIHETWITPILDPRQESPSLAEVNNKLGITSTEPCCSESYGKFEAHSDWIIKLKENS